MLMSKIAKIWLFSKIFCPHDLREAITGGACLVIGIKRGKNKEKKGKDEKKEYSGASHPLRERQETEVRISVHQGIGKIRGPFHLWFTIDDWRLTIPEAYIDSFLRAFVSSWPKICVHPLQRYKTQLKIPIDTRDVPYFPFWALSFSEAAERLWDCVTAL